MQDNRKFLGIRVSPEFHKIIKQTALNNDITIQDYILGLIMADAQADQNKRIPERHFSKCYHDFMDSTLLNGEEKIVFLALKRFSDVKSDNGNVFPSIETIQKIMGWGNQKVIKHIKSLVNKGLVKKVQQGLTKPNIYILSDEPDLWEAENIEQLKETVGKTEEHDLTHFLP